MKKFLVLYMAPVAATQEMMKNMTPEDHKKDMEAWTAWMQKHETSFVDQGAPAGKNTRVTKDGITEASNEVLGYSIMQAESKEALLKIIQESNHLDMPQSYTEVMECLEMPSI